MACLVSSIRKGCTFSVGSVQLAQKQPLIREVMCSIALLRSKNDISKFNKPNDCPCVNQRVKGMNMQSTGFPLFFVSGPLV